MQLENIAIALRPRSAWEAIDLGYAMVQKWASPVMKAWLAVYLPAALLINLACWKLPWIAVLILWWLKPAFDRVVLHVLAGAVFGATPSLKDTLRALKRLWWNNGLFAALTYARFNFARSFTLPVVQLEGSRGKLGRKRRAVLSREGWSVAVMLSYICVHVEVILLVSFTMLFAILTPGESTREFSFQALFLTEPNRVEQYFSNFLGALVVSFLEPFYVAAGFAIYLNCRTAIEGWDVELQFKRMAARLAAGASATRAGAAAAAPLRRVAAIVLATAVLWMGLPAEQRALAQTPQPQQTEETEGGSCKLDDTAVDEPGDGAANVVTGKPSTTPDTGAQEAAREILRSKEFGEYEKSWKLNYIGPKWASDEDKPKKRNYKWLQAIGEFLGTTMRVLAWVGGGLLILFLLYVIARHIGRNGWGGDRGFDAPDVLFGLDVRPESLPDDIPAEARRLLGAGDARGAIGLMYRGALVSLIQDGRIDIARGDTELECVMRMRRVYRGDAGGAAKAEYFAEMVTIWQRVAYAKKPVSADEITPLIDRWPHHFAIRRQAADKPAGGKPARTANAGGAA
jgi:hypothetical protein